MDELTMARAIATALGDDLDHAFVNKAEWNRARGEKGGRIRDINEPMLDDYLAAAKAAIALLPPVGDGWVVVPKEPTEEMLKAAGKYEDQCAIQNYGGCADAEGIWSAMIQAAPSGRGAG